MVQNTLPSVPKFGLEAKQKSLHNAFTQPNRIFQEALEDGLK